MQNQDYYHTRASLYKEETRPEDIGKKTNFPSSVQPMGIKVSRKLWYAEGAGYFVSWNGCRTMVMKHKSTINLFPQNYHYQFYPIYQALAKWDCSVVVDGEIVVLDNNGKPVYGPPTDWKRLEDGQLHYYIFDLLWLNGYSLKEIPLNMRLALLEDFIPLDAPIRIAEELIGTFENVVNDGKRRNIREIMQRNFRSEYTEGKGGEDWLRCEVDWKSKKIVQL